MSISIHSQISAAVYENENVKQRDERRKALLGVRGLRKRHGERLLFDIDRLEIATHSAYVLTGMNGAGKSTLLRVLGGLERAEIDSLRFAGEDVLRVHPYPRALRRDIVYVHQHPILFSTSVADNIGYGLVVRGEKPEAVRPVVAEAMEPLSEEALSPEQVELLAGNWLWLRATETAECALMWLVRAARR